MDVSTWATSAKDKASGIMYHLICPRRFRIRGFYNILFAPATEYVDKWSWRGTR
jgi:hypothetical protein